MKSLFISIMCASSMLLSPIVLAHDTNPAQQLFSFHTNKVAKKKKKSWSKDVWSIIAADQKVNASVFYPLNERLPGYDYLNDALKVELFELHNESIHWNLWTIMIYHFIKGELLIHSSYDPEWMMNQDNGFLAFPLSPAIIGSSAEGTFETDSLFRSNILEGGYIGETLYDPYAMPLKSWYFPDEDSLIYNEKTGFFEAVYPKPDYVWYRDIDIISYKLKEKWQLDKNGNVIDKEIMAIAPTIMAKNELGEDQGERDLFWVDFKQLSSLIKSYFIKIDRYRQDRIISLYDFFETREFFADPILQDSLHVR